MADSFRLGANSTTGDFDHDPEFILGVAESESVVNNPLPRRPVEELVHRLAVDQDWATIIYVQTNTSYRGLALARPIVIGLVCFSLYQGDSILRSLTLEALRIRLPERRGGGQDLYRP